MFDDPLKMPALKMPAIFLNVLTYMSATISLERSSITMNQKHASNILSTTFHHILKQMVHHDATFGKNLC